MTISRRRIGRSSRRSFLPALVCVLTAVFYPASPVGAQEPGPPTRLWLGAGLAAGPTSEFDGGLGVLARLVWQDRPHHVELRATGLSDFSSFPDGGDDSVTELAVLVGRVRTNPYGSAAVAAGVAWVVLDGCPGEGTSTCSTPGLALSAEIALQSRLFGIGLQAFGNLNARSSLLGLALLVHLGWMPGPS